jgi:hypothetical protein
MRIKFRYNEIWGLKKVRMRFTDGDKEYWKRLSYSQMVFQRVNLNKLACNKLSSQGRNRICYGDIVIKLHTILFRNIDTQARNAEYIVL